MIADGVVNSVAVGSLSEISTVASDDVLVGVDTCGGGLKDHKKHACCRFRNSGSFIGNVVEDTTPQLGGDVDGQNKNVEDIVLSDDHVGRYGSSFIALTFTVTVASNRGHHYYQGDGSSSCIRHK